MHAGPCRHRARPECLRRGDQLGHRLAAQAQRYEESRGTCLAGAPVHDLAEGAADAVRIALPPIDKFEDRSLHFTRHADAR